MPKTSPEAADQHLQNAREAAQQGQPDTMLEELTRSGFVDGAVRGLEHKWSGKLPRVEIEEALAVAVDSAYAGLREGKTIRNLGAFLWKAADNDATDRWRRDHSRRLELNGEETTAAPVTPDERAAMDERAELRRAEALRRARQFLPRIGTGQVLAVMDMLIEAVETGMPDLPPASIAEALGITEDVARTLLSRGINRLRREARREGIAFPEDLDELEQDLEGAEGAES